MLDRGVFLLERILTPEERIRRAEEIYNRRRQGETRSNIATVNVREEKNYGLFKKLILQMLICLVIYFIFYLIQNGNYIFSQDVLNKAKEILSYDINLPAMYEQTIKFFEDQYNQFMPVNEINDNNTISNEINNEIANTVQENAIGGAELENTVVESNNEEQTQEQVEEKQDVSQTDDEYIKSNFSFIKPVEGIVSSEFGVREASNPIVSKNHSGIDIAANTGTVIRASMEGTVTISSTTGDYGYHIKIENQDVATLYAHCSKLYVNKGDVVKQGQEIAEVGSTGKSTGPHLHFEIMRGSTYINPRNILQF